MELSLALTNIYEVDMKILHCLNDKDLANLCQVNRYLRTLCQDEYFLKKRILTLYPEAKNKPINYSWLQWYYFIVRNNSDEYSKAFNLSPELKYLRCLSEKSVCRQSTSFQTINVTLPKAYKFKDWELVNYLISLLDQVNPVDNNITYGFFDYGLIISLALENGDNSNVDILLHHFNRNLSRYDRDDCVKFKDHIKKIAYTLGKYNILEQVEDIISPIRSLDHNTFLTSYFCGLISGFHNTQAKEVFPLLIDERISIYRLIVIEAIRVRNSEMVTFAIKLLPDDNKEAEIYVDIFHEELVVNKLILLEKTRLSPQNVFRVLLERNISHVMDFYRQYKDKIKSLVFIVPSHHLNYHEDEFIRSIFYKNIDYLDFSQCSFELIESMMKDNKMSDDRKVVIVTRCALAGRYDVLPGVIKYISSSSWQSIMICLCNINYKDIFIYFIRKYYEIDPDNANKYLNQLLTILKCMPEPHEMYIFITKILQYDIRHYHEIDFYSL